MAEPDFEMYAVNDPLIPWHLDIDILDGWATSVHGSEANISKQRKSIAAFQQLGSIPGDEGRGVNWGALLASSTEYVAVMTEAQKAAQEADSRPEQALLVEPGGPGSSYVIRVIDV